MSCSPRRGQPVSPSLPVPVPVLPVPVPLLTLDEARSAVVRSAARCVAESRCAPSGLQRMLWGQAGEWSTADRALAAHHRQVLEEVARAGHGWIVAAQVEGIISATEGAGGAEAVVSLARLATG
jgi:hypothetical protein